MGRKRSFSREEHPNIIQQASAFVDPQHHVSPWCHVGDTVAGPSAPKNVKSRSDPDPVTVLRYALLACLAYTEDNHRLRLLLTCVHALIQALQDHKGSPACAMDIIDLFAPTAEGSLGNIVTSQPGSNAASGTSIPSGAITMQIAARVFFRLETAERRHLFEVFLAGRPGSESLPKTVRPLRHYTEGLAVQLPKATLGLDQAIGIIRQLCFRLDTLLFDLTADVLDEEN